MGVFTIRSSKNIKFVKGSINRMNCKQICIWLLFANLSIAEAASNGKCRIKFDLDMCLTKTDFRHKGCNAANTCQRNINLSYVKLEPYGFDIVTDTLRTCCGGCVNISNVQMVDRISQINDSEVSNSHFVYPVLAPPSTKSLYGYHFLPMVETPSVYYITNKSEDMLRKLIYSCVDMWPLVVIVLLLIVISGFICWFIETWWNQDEFPRPLLIGWFEGIWWSFISMTTVGYGDKVPKSVPARLFSIAWIFIGITTFSLVTAMLASEIISANTVPPPKMVGARIAAMRDRLYDAILVAKSGGVIHEIDQANATDGIHRMVHKLKEKKIEGFVLDKYTMLLFYYVFKDSPIYKHDVMYLMTKTIHTEISEVEQQFAYGVLIRDHEDYEFLLDFVRDNRVVLNTCNSLLINRLSSEGTIQETERNPLFSTSGEIFWSSFITIITIILLLFCTGMVYEVRRKRQKRNPLCRKKVAV